LALSERKPNIFERLGLLGFAALTANLQVMAIRYFFMMFRFSLVMPLPGALCVTIQPNIFEKLLIIEEK